MVLNSAQINETITQLKQVLSEQQRILTDTEKVVLGDLAGAWECQAQQAYADAFVGLRDSVLSQVNALIELFGTAFEQSQNGLYQVDVDIASMNAKAL